METLNYNRLHEIIMEQYEDLIREKERSRTLRNDFNDSVVGVINNPTLENITKSVSKLAKTMGEDADKRKEARDDIDNYLYVENRIKR
jgi:hypothetical protein